MSTSASTGIGTNTNTNTIDPALIDAHLFVAGITSDARNQRILLIGDYSSDPMCAAFAQRLVSFGADVISTEQYVEREASGSVDYVVLVNPAPMRAALRMAEEAMKRDGLAKYVVVITPAAVGQLIATDVTLVGEDCVRMTGIKQRDAGT